MSNSKSKKEIDAEVAKTLAEAQQISAEIEKTKAETKKLELEQAKIALDLERVKIYNQEKEKKKIRRPPLVGGHQAARLTFVVTLKIIDTLIL